MIHTQRANRATELGTSVVYCIKPQRDKEYGLNTLAPRCSQVTLWLVSALLILSGATACEEPGYSLYEVGDAVFLGTHTYRAVLPDEFDTFREGQEVAVVIGTQGSMMVVAAIKTNRVPISDDPFTVSVTLSDKDGFELSHLTLRRYPTLESDMMMYFSNLYAVVTATLEDEYSWDGEFSSLRVQVRALDDTIYIDETIELRLRATEELF